MKRQTDGELDDSRLTEGLTGEATVYKRRGMAKPEIGRPQIKSVTSLFVLSRVGSNHHWYKDPNESGSSLILALQCRKLNLQYKTYVDMLTLCRYRFQYDGRLARSLETAVMLMETFNRLTRQDKYVWDVCALLWSVLPLTLTSFPRCLDM